MSDRYSNGNGAAKGSGFQLNKPTVVALLYIFGTVLTAGVATFIGAVLAFIWKDEGEEAWMRSHFRFHIRTFLYSLLMSLIGLALWFLALKWFVFILIGLWIAARSFLALMEAQKARPVPNPRALFW